jgi:topoisomerase IV subunit A
VRRGRGAILQCHNKGGLADLTTLTAKDGLSWRSGQQGVRNEANIKRWIGKRAQAGLMVPKGFARANRF